MFRFQDFFWATVKEPSAPRPPITRDPLSEWWAEWWEKQDRREREDWEEAERVHAERRARQYTDAYRDAALAFDNAHPNYLAAYGEACL